VTLSGVVGRVAVILAAFDADTPEMGLNELARATQLPKTTVHRLANELVAHGFLDRSGTRYLLGTRLFELGQRVPSRRLLRETALPFLEDVFVATNETVHLAVVDDAEVFYVERLAGHRSTGTPSAVGGHLPMHCTATGKALLAHSAPDLVERVIAAGLKRRTAFTIVVPSLLLAELDKIREGGAAVEREETRLGFVSVAAPVFDRTGTVLAAISVTGPRSRLDPEHVVGAVRAAARGLTRVLRSTHA
jgi:DNA-binding IclR family transcriptional regulator